MVLEAKNPSKIHPESHEEYDAILDASWMALGRDFWWILAPSWETSWDQIGSKIGGPGTPREGDLGGGKNGSMD